MSQEEGLLQGESNGCVTVLNADRIERSDVVPMLSADSELPDNDDDAHKSLHITRKYVPVIRMHKPKTCENKKRIVIVVVGGMFVFLSLVFLVTGTIRFNQCQPEQIASEWDKRFLGMHFDDLVGLNNFALEKFVNQTSMAYDGTDGPPELAVDGDLKTCSRTDAELSPRLQIDLKYQRPIGFILVHGNRKNTLHDISIYIVGEDNIANITAINSFCDKHLGVVKTQVIATDCGRPLNGRYIIIEMTNSKKSLDNLMICEVMVIQR